MWTRPYNRSTAVAVALYRSARHARQLKKYMRLPTLTASAHPHFRTRSCCKADHTSVKPLSKSPNSAVARTARRTAGAKWSPRSANGGFYCHNKRYKKLASGSQQDDGPSLWVEYVEFHVLPRFACFVGLFSCFFLFLF